MLKEFKAINEDKICVLERSVNDLKEILDQLSQWNIPNDVFTKTDLKNLCTSFIQNQQNDIENLQPGSWCLNKEMIYNSEARVDFVFFPTYYVIAILTRVLMEYPEIAHLIPDYNDTLKRGYLFSSYRSLQGHGIDSTEYLIKAFEILVKGRVTEYLNSDKNFSPALYALIKKIIKDARKKLKTGKTVEGFDRDYKEGYEYIISVTKELNFN